MARKKVERETPEVAQMIGRMIVALGRRVAEGDPVDLGEFSILRTMLAEAERAAVEGQRRADAHGEPRFSWAQIAEGLGTTRQNAQQRFTNRKA